MAGEPFSLTLTLRDGFQFAADFEDASVPELLLDEPPPLGEGRGSNAARLLGAAVGNCLGASLVYCLRRAHIAVRQLRVKVEGAVVRNERGRLRIGELRVTLYPDLPAEEQGRIGRCLDLFEDFCIVTESVRSGINVQVAVEAQSAEPAETAPAVTAAG
jgi:uncharacterized OsmC-like protein